MSNNRNPSIETDFLVPERLTVDGSTYALAVHADDKVRLSIDVTNREREALRHYADHNETTMADVVRTALSLITKPLCKANTK